MLDISLVRDLDTNKIKYLQILHGYHCMKAYCCKHGEKCKYRRAYVFHNFDVAVHRFFEYRLHIKLPHLLYINKMSTDLSGTTKCPHGMSRNYTCYDCKSCLNPLEKMCNNKQRIEALDRNEDLTVHDPEWGPYNYCKFFEKDDYADRWDKDTGERIFE